MSSQQPSGRAADARWGVVPYITAWSSETMPPPVVVSRGRGIGYADETLFDRDRDGVLWARSGVSPGVGRPQFKNVHCLRQRRAMRKLLCQVCGVACGEDGVWMLSVREYADGEGPWPAPVVTAHPPLCPDCVERSGRLCPHLRDGFVVLKARRFRPGAVSGMLYELTGGGLRAVGRETVAYGHPLVRWLQASQLHMRLEDYTVVA
jgi:hypothetical protein